jgi:hypothetical protein
MAITLNGTGSISGLTSGAGIAATALSGQVPDANAPSGSVLQVVQGTLSTETTTTSSSFVTTGVSASITPSSTSSKIVVFMALGDVGTSDASSGVSIALFRNDSQIGNNLSARHCYVDTSATENYIINQWASCYHDSPSSTSSLTYSIRFNNAGAGTVKVMRDSTQGSIILMEISA